MLNELLRSPHSLLSCDGGRTKNRETELMGKWFLIASGVIVISTAIAVFIGQARERSKADRLVETLIQSASCPVTGTVDFNSFSELPLPVALYFKHVLSEGQELIRTAKMRQSGVLRTSTTTERWSSFTANQLVVPPATGFVWNAKVGMPLARTGCGTFLDILTRDGVAGRSLLY